MLNSFLWRRSAVKAVNSAFFLRVLFCLLIALARPARADDKPAVLNVYNWHYYIGPTTIRDFEAEYNIKVNYDNFSTNEELLAKLQTGVTGYDVIFPSDYMVKIMIGQGLLTEISLNNIPNFEHVEDRLKSLPFDPGNKYCVPYQWASSGLAVNTVKVNEKITSWDVLWDEKYKGRISIMDDMRVGLVPALKKLGYSINTKSAQELDKAKQLMFKQKPLSKAYTQETPLDLLRSGEVWIANAYSGDVYQVAKSNPAVKYVIPKEGTSLFVDNICVVKGAPHRREAELFMNYILRPEVSAAISNEIGYAGVNRTAKKFIKPEILNDPNVFPSETMLEKSEYLDDMGEITPLYERTWGEIKIK